jgi:hypothetical protein
LVLVVLEAVEAEGRYGGGNLASTNNSKCWNLLIQVVAVAVQVH